MRLIMLSVLLLISCEGEINNPSRSKPVELTKIEKSVVSNQSFDGKGFMSFDKSTSMEDIITYLVNTGANYEINPDLQGKYRKYILGPALGISNFVNCPNISVVVASDFDFVGHQLKNVFFVFNTSRLIVIQVFEYADEPHKIGQINFMRELYRKKYGDGDEQSYSPTPNIPNTESVITSVYTNPREHFKVVFKKEETFISELYYTQDSVSLWEDIASKKIRSFNEEMIMMFSEYETAKENCFEIERDRMRKMEVEQREKQRIEKAKLENNI